MNLIQKARLLADGGKHDTCGFKACEIKINNSLGGIYHAKAEHKTCRIFKTLMNNTCKFDCKYCSNANCGAKQKVAYKPEELAGIFDHLNKKLNVSGLFLSSGIGTDPDRETERMIEAVRIVRKKQKFRGYIHFKVLPGTSYHLVKHAAAYVNRMSVNIEFPNKSIMSEFSSCKDFKTDILRRQAWLSHLNLSGGQTTQLILSDHVTDNDVLKMMRWEYDALDLRRVYFKSFMPTKGTPLENEKPGSMLRQNNLYHVDFLVRQYGYSFKEFQQIAPEGMLPSEDPKLALAKLTFDRPVDINDSSFEELIRVPGIGPVTAKKLCEHKKQINSFKELQQIGVRLKTARPFINVNGSHQKMLSAF